MPRIGKMFLDVSIISNRKRAAQRRLKLTVNIIHADTKILAEGRQTVVALAGASVVGMNEPRCRRATDIGTGRAAAEHRASFRAGT